MGDWLSSAWDWYQVNREALVPLGTVLISLGTFIAGVVIAIAALRQARTAAKQATIAAEQASIAARRHNAQTDADRQRRITESYAKAVEQLGSDKIEIRLGGIYTLERISKESPDDYWTVMETLTAFVRVRTPVPVKEADEISEADLFAPAPATDIAAILSILRRRDGESQRREAEAKWIIDLHYVDLSGADLTNANLSRANLFQADLDSAYLNGANLTDANLAAANLTGAYLTGADLSRANLGGANLTLAYLSDTNLTDANLYATKITQAQLNLAYGENVKLPPGMTLKPCRW